MSFSLRNVSRPKALAASGIAAGVLAVSGAAAAMNVGLLSSHQSTPFAPQNVSVTDQPPTTTTAAPEPEIVYEDVYEHVPASTAPSAPSATTGAVHADDPADDHPSTPAVSPAPATPSHDVSDEGPDDATDHESDHEAPEVEDHGEDD